MDGGLTPPIPSWDAEEPPPFIKDDLRSAGNHDVQLLVQRWVRQDNGLRRRWVKAVLARRYAARQVQVARGAYYRASERYQDIHGEHAPAVGWERSLSYIIWMALLFLFELPLNAIVFRIFQENEVLTVLLTCGVAVVLLLSAHELGRLLREGAWDHPTTRLFIIGLVLFPLLIVGGVAYAREAYLSFLPDALQALNPWIVYIAFAAINLGIFAVATILSYRHYEAGLGEVILTRNRLARSEAAFTGAKQRERSAHDLRLGMHEYVRAVRERLEIEVQRLQGLYQTENLVSRMDRERDHATEFPRSFLRQVTLSRPPELEAGKLDWTVDEENEDTVYQTIPEGA